MNACKINKNHMSAKDSLRIENVKIDKCAGCETENPEYVLEDRQLCFDCYTAEKCYWAK